MTVTDDVTGRHPNPTQPNRWPPRMGGPRSDGARPGAREATPNREGVNPTQGDRRSGPPAFLTNAIDRIAADRDGIWSKKTPTLADLVRYAREGQQMAEDSKLRGLALAYVYAVAVPATAFFYWLAWVFQRPLRLAALVVVVVLAALFLP